VGKNCGTIRKRIVQGTALKHFTLRGGGERVKLSQTQLQNSRPRTGGMGFWGGLLKNKRGRPHTKAKGGDVKNRPLKFFQVCEDLLSDVKKQSLEKGVSC